MKLRCGQEAGTIAVRLFTRTMKYWKYLRHEVWPRTPFTPLLRFAYMYVLRLGVLDGAPGLHMAMMMTAYECIIELLYRDKLNHVEAGLLPRPGGAKKK